LGVESQSAGLRNNAAHFRKTALTKRVQMYKDNPAFKAFIELGQAVD